MTQKNHLKLHPAGPKPSSHLQEEVWAGVVTNTMFHNRRVELRAGKRTRVQRPEDLLKPDEVPVDGKGGRTSPGLPVAIHSLGSSLPLSRCILWFP